ncbi:MAG: hypothetical protein M1819_006837 [Sarea resinae]|nr:MAG: hypothetical protein M1819_006837 [Sarea resinae]
MSSYLSSILTTTTSRYNSLRRNLLSDEVDGDTEDDSHISRALRAYYTEKGRPFPPWLPPDPKAPQLAPAQYVTSNPRPGLQPVVGRSGGGLSDLWDSPQQAQQEPSLSLRSGRGPSSRPSIGRGSSNSFHNGSTRREELAPPPAARPLPSQRAGSYQSQFAQQAARDAYTPSPPPSAGSGSSARDRLKARFWSGDSANPAQSAASAATSGQRSPYERGNSHGAGAGAGSAVGAGHAGGPLIDRGRFGSGGGRDQKPYVSAGSPWTSGDPNLSGGGYGQGRR